MTKTLISTRSTLIYIYKDVSLNTILVETAKHAELAIGAIEKTLYETLLKDDESRVKFIVQGFDQ